LTGNLTPVNAKPQMNPNRLMFGIHEVVEALVSNMTGLNNFVEERNTINGENYLSYFLTPICQKFGIYNEIDLVLISFGCKVTIHLHPDIFCLGISLPSTF
jgi:hypothetical protein